jgi:Na+/H+-dicarboxylate symporter
LFPSFAPAGKLISEKFIDLIKMIIAPIIFFTIVLGIAGAGDMKKVGRVGGKALLYFEIVTTLALVIGLLVGHIVQPAKGLMPVTCKQIRQQLMRVRQKILIGLNSLRTLFPTISSSRLPKVIYSRFYFSASCLGQRLVSSVSMAPACLRPSKRSVR